MIASASTPGRSASIRDPPPAGAGRTSTDPKNTRTATGMPTIARRFSPRRAVRRSSIAVWPRVAATGDAGGAHDSPDQFEIGVLERPADRRQLDDPPVGGRAPARQRGDRRRARGDAVDPIAPGLERDHGAADGAAERRDLGRVERAIAG